MITNTTKKQIRYTCSLIGMIFGVYSVYHYTPISVGYITGLFGGLICLILSPFFDKKEV